MHRLLVIILLCFCACYSHAQDETPWDYFDESTAGLEQYEEILAILGPTIISQQSDSLRSIYNEKFEYFVYKALSNPDSFDFPFTQVISLSCQTSKDKKLRLYTWVYPYENGEYFYHGFIQYRHDGEMELLPLVDMSDELEDVRFSLLKPEEWYGCLYYEIVTRKWNDKVYYTLLGWDGNNIQTTKRIVEILTIEEDGSLQFGAPIFDVTEDENENSYNLPFEQLTETEIPHRLIYEYMSASEFRLEYYRAKDFIIVNHLNRLDDDKSNFMEYHGKKITFNALNFEEGIWKLHIDLSGIKQVIKKKGSQRNARRR